MWRRLATSPVRAAVCCALVTALAFAPSLWLGFVWDDDVNIAANPHLTLDRSGLGWMLTTFREIHPAWGGQWIPLTWLSFAATRAVVGLVPWGYHLGNVLLHAGSAAFVCLIAWRLLAKARPAASSTALALGAVTASLAWALHPLRVEAVVWITERREVLAGTFALGSVLAYLRATTGPRRRWGAWGVSLACFAAACASKMSVATLPVLLLLLDAYPLRRLRGAWGRCLMEKGPYGLLVGGVAGLTLLALHTARSLSGQPLLERVGLAAYAAVFYLGKSLWPTGLSLLYEAPRDLSLADPRLAWALVAVGAITVGLVVWRRQWPAGLATWIAYLVVLAPQSGLLHAGYALAADRYSYLPAIAPAILLGAGVATIGVEHTERNV